MTTSDLAQSTMANQALETSLSQSIASLSGVSSAQVFLALPQDTPFPGRSAEADRLGHRRRR